MNKFIGAGGLTRDPELKSVAGGKSVCNFTLATKKKYPKDGKGSDYHNIVVWGKQAESCAKYLRKGSQVAIEGRMETRNYSPDWAGGKKVYFTEVIAEDVEFLGKKGDSKPRREEPTEVMDSDLPFDTKEPEEIDDYEGIF